MKSMKLNQIIRDDILLSIMKTWDARNVEPDVGEAEARFAMWLWSRHVGKDAKALESVPDKYLNKKTAVAYSYDGTVNQVTLAKAMAAWWGRYETPVLEVFEKEHRELKRFNKVVSDKGVWSEKRNEVERESSIVLDSVNTTKQLIEMWPQCEPFLPAYVANPDKAVRLPAIPLSRLNERLGIKA